MAVNKQRSFFVSGGTLPPDSASYIERFADRHLLESLLAGRFCYVLNPRQMGKSSLSVHTIDRLNRTGVRIAFVDLTRIGGKNATPEQWYSGLALGIARGLNCRAQALSYWKEHESLPPVQRLFGVICEVALAEIPPEAPVVVFIDEIDATRNLSFDCDEFFGAIRECFNRRVTEPILERLTFCLIGVAVPSDLIRNRATTPFNIGERITLEDFTRDELSVYAPHLGPKGTEVIARVFHWTGGHPFLSQSLCRSIAAEASADAATVDGVVKRELFEYKARDSNINLADVANIALHYDDSEVDGSTLRADLLSAYQRVLSGREVVDDEANRALVRLKLSGIVRSDGRRLTLRNRIYRHVFDQKWVDEHLPNQELRRQRQSFRRGVLRAALVSGLILALLGGFAAFAWRSRMEALAAQAKLNYELYVSDMNSLRLYYNDGDTARIGAILSRHRNSPYRGFEWAFWLARYHDSPEEYSLDYSAPGKRLDGHMSANGAEICLVDQLTKTATIVDRVSKRAVTTVRISDPRMVVALKSRWAEIIQNPSGYRVVDLKSGRSLAQIGDPHHVMSWVAPIEHTDLIATGESASVSTRCQFINIWDAETGQKLRALPDLWANGFPVPPGELFAMSADGQTILNVLGPKGKIEGKAWGEAIVRDLTKNLVIDTFPIENDAEDMAPGPFGRFLFYSEQGKISLRDVRLHRTIAWSPSIPGDWRLEGAAISGNTLVSVLDGGRCVTQSLSDLKRSVPRENVFSVAAGAHDGQFLASSNSVRVYDAGTPASGEVVGRGRRITRYGNEVINAFGVDPWSVTRLDERSFAPRAAARRVSGGADLTYSGHWTLEPDERGSRDVLRSVESGAPVRLPFVPTLWSCGYDAESIVLWGSRSTGLVAYSGHDRRIRWSRPDVLGVNSIWASPDGSKVYVANHETQMSVYDMSDGRLLGTLNALNVGPLNLSFSSNGRFVFTCGGDGRAIMWDTHSLKKLMEFRGNEQQAVTSADISPDGRRVVTTNQAGSWQLWDVSTGVSLLDVHVSAAPLSSALFSSDGRRIVTAGEDNDIRVWRTVDSDPTTYISLDRAYLARLRS